MIKRSIYTLLLSLFLLCVTAEPAIASAHNIKHLIANRYNNVFTNTSTSWVLLVYSMSINNFQLVTKCDQWATSSWLYVSSDAELCFEEHNLYNNGSVWVGPGNSLFIVPSRNSTVNIEQLNSNFQRGSTAYSPHIESIAYVI